MILDRLLGMWIKCDALAMIGRLAGCERLHGELLRRLQDANRVAGCQRRLTLGRWRPKKRPATGRNPTDCGRPGRRPHLLTDGPGIPPSFVLTTANLRDSGQFERPPETIPSIGGERGRLRRRPGQPDADKPRDRRRCRPPCQRLRATPRIARPGVETSDGLRRYRRVVDHMLAWLNRFRRLTARCE